MFCTNCGKQGSVGDKFCFHCGTPFPTAVAHQEAGSADREPSATEFPDSTPNTNAQAIAVPDLGEPIYVLRKARRLLPRYKEPPTVPLPWLYDHVDVAFTKSYLLVVSATPTTALKDLANTVSERLPALGLVGGALSLAVFSAGNAAQRLFGQSTELSCSTLTAMVKSGVAIYAPKANLQCNLFHLKKPILYFYDEVHVNGTFTWLNQPVHLSLRFNDEDLPDTLAKKYFLRGECNLAENQGRITAQDSAAIRSKEYPISVERGSLP